MKVTIPLTLSLVAATAVQAAPVDPAAAAAKIDALVAANYRKHKVKPNPIADDERFVRRVYLDIVGRIPTADEAEAFLDQAGRGKRQALVDRLLGSAGYVSHEFNFWSDLLRIKSRLPGNNGDTPRMYREWVKRSIAENKPYNDFVHDLVSAQGISDENGAVGFYLRDRGMPLDHMSNTVQLFLGTQMLCAQCHDHPFDEWTQMDYYKLASFSAQMETTRIPTKLTDRLRQASKTMGKGERRQLQRSVQNLFRPFQNAAISESGRDLRLPHDYQYDDAKPKDLVTPQTPFGEIVKLGEGESRVEAYADWMTSPENPRFTKLIANRLWKRVMGVGIVEPVDDFDNAEKATNPELMEYLTGLMKEMGYDMKAFYEVLYATKTYQREVSSHDLASGKPYHFPGPRLRRMSAEQVWDSMVTLLRETPDETVFVPEGEAAESPRAIAFRKLQEADVNVLMENSKKLSALVELAGAETEKIRKKVEDAVALKGKNPRAANRAAQQAMDRLNAKTDEIYGEYARLSFLGDDADSIRRLNGGLTNGPRQLARRLTREFPTVKKKAERRFVSVNMGSYAKNLRKESDIRREYQRIRSTQGAAAAKAFAKENKMSKVSGRYVRASELPSPAPQGHFLREFGQSDREIIENSSGDATVPQALTLLNGEALSFLRQQGSSIAARLGAAKTAAEKTEALYLSFLGRRPTAEEKDMVLREFRQDPKHATESVAWALLNSSQFLFIE